MAGKAQIMKRASAAVDLFIEEQKKAGRYEVFNRVNAKWTMKDIIEQIDDDQLVRKLIKFFFLTSESKTWDDFQWNYEEYLESWLDYLNSYYQRKVLQEETVQKGLENS